MDWNYGPQKPLDWIKNNLTRVKMYQHQPIPTYYKGISFRSRLEARWAVFYDTLRIPWDYELQGIKLGGGLGLYLPDFWLPDQKYVIEIKPIEPTNKQQDLVQAILPAFNAKMGLIFYGGIPLADELGYSHSAIALSSTLWDIQYWWCQCPKCGKLGVEYTGRAERIGCGCFSYSDKCYNSTTDKLTEAYIIARSKKF